MKAKTTIATYVLLAVGLAATASFVFCNGRPGELAWWRSALGFFAWAAAPFVAVAVMNVFLAGTLTGRVTLLLTALAIAVGGLCVLVQAFVIHPDAQSGIVLIFLPLCQWIVVGIGAVMSIAARARARRKPV